MLSIAEWFFLILCFYLNILNCYSLFGTLKPISCIYVGLICDVTVGGLVLIAVFICIFVGLIVGVIVAGVVLITVIVIITCKIRLEYLKKISLYMKLKF